MFALTPNVNITAKACLRALSISIIQSELVTIMASLHKQRGVLPTPLLGLGYTGALRKISHRRLREPH